MVLLRYWLSISYFSSQILFAYFLLASFFWCLRALPILLEFLDNFFMLFYQLAVLLGSTIFLYSRLFFLLLAALFLVLDSWVPLRFFSNWNFLVFRAPCLKVLLRSVVAVRPVPGRLGVPALCRSHPGLLRCGLLYRLICLVLDNTLRFLFYYRAPCNSPYSRRTSRDCYSRLFFLFLTLYSVFFRMLYTRFYSGLSCGNRSTLYYFNFLISGQFFVLATIFL
jgi:hypothetical protein